MGNALDSVADCMKSSAAPSKPLHSGSGRKHIQNRAVRADQALATFRTRVRAAGYAEYEISLGVLVAVNCSGACVDYRGI